MRQVWYSVQPEGELKKTSGTRRLCRAAVRLRPVRATFSQEERTGGAHVERPWCGEGLRMQAVQEGVQDGEIVKDA